MTPIWKDYIFSFDDYSVPSDGILFRIYAGSTLAYQGKAYPNPDSGETEVRINDIIAPYLFSYQTWSGSQGYNRLFQAFSIDVYDEDNEAWDEDVDTGVFSPDWSYETGYNPALSGCNHPVLESFQAGQVVPLSFVGSGTHVVYIDSQTLMGDFCDDFNSDFLLLGSTTRSSVSYSGDANGHAHWLNLASYPNAVAVIVDGVTYPVVQNCCRYILYYINAYGYWDSFPVYCKTKETDKLTRHTYKKDYNNGTAYARGAVNHVNELERQFVFYTDWLNEQQSSRMPHLLNATCVYVKDNLKNEVRPLILTNSNTEHKRGGQLYQYTIEATLAQDRIRR